LHPLHPLRALGEEIANLRELGATGRGEFVRIGTYVTRELVSELSGNIIDLCPVGALTAKPSRMRYRAWELTEHPSVAAHDGLGSNVFVHTLRGRVIRVVPRDNEQVNETWLSDRDRFSYTGLTASDRATAPMVKDKGEWRPVPWEAALQRAAEGLKGLDPQRIGFLISPNATTEEAWLFQRLARALGSPHVDHRLRQTDFSADAADPLFPWLGCDVAALESMDAVFVVGSDLRAEQPLVAHRLRKMVRGGGRLMGLNPAAFDWLCAVAPRLAVPPAQMVGRLARVVAVAGEGEVPDSVASLVRGAEPDEADAAVAEALRQAGDGLVLLGALAMQHPEYGRLRALADTLARRTGARLGFLPEGANAAGLWLAGCLPHRGPVGERLGAPGRAAGAQLAEPLDGYVLFGVEPALDAAAGAAALRTLERAECVVAVTGFVTDELLGCADVVLPLAQFTETSGTFVSYEGRWQSFRGVVAPPGDARPGWKILRVLANHLELEGFEQGSSAEVLDELRGCLSEDLTLNNTLGEAEAAAHDWGEGLQRAGGVPVYSGDALVRRAAPLQSTPIAGRAEVRMHPDEAREQGLAGAERVVVTQGEGRARLPLVLDEVVPRGCVWIPVAVPGVETLGPAFGNVQVEAG
jgi:NADH-quinone oxidoreductase subunit G